MIARRRVFPLVGLIASVALVWSVTAGVLYNADTPTQLEEQKFANAKRLVFYRVNAGGTLRMQMPAGAESLRISTHLVLADGSAYSPERQYLYGVQLRLSDPDGKTIFERPLFTRTRQSKAEPQSGTWLKESAFTNAPNVQITDEREFLLELPQEVRDQPGTLELHYPGPSGAVLLRTYARIDRRAKLFPTREATRVQLAEDRVEKATFVPWEKLPFDLQQSLVEERWQRLDALGEPGTDFLTDAVYHTDFRVPLVEVARAEEERLPAQRGAAVNVLGPARLVVWIWRDLAAANAPGRPGPVHISTLTSVGETQSWNVTVPESEPVRQTIDLPAGAQSVSIVNQGEADVRFTVEGPRAAWIAPEALKVAGDGADAALVPDTRRIEAHVTGPGCPAIELDLGVGLDDASRLVRIDARTLGADANAEASSLTVSLEDGRGHPLGEAGFEAPAEGSPFESADLAMAPSGRIPCTGGSPADVPAKTVEITDQTAPLGEAATTRVFAPPGARKLWIRASRPTAITLYSFVPSPQQAELADPYAAFDAQGMRWRNAPLDGQHWRAIRPANHRALADAGARVAVLGQVRLEPSAPIGRQFPLQDAVALKPLGAPASKQILEVQASLPLHPSDQDRSQGAYALLSPNRISRLHFDARTPTRPELRLEVRDESALGEMAQVLVDGEPVRRFRIRTTRVRQLLPPIRPGAHEVMLRTAATDLSAVVNRAPAGNEPPLRLRTTWRVGDALRVNVRKKGPAATTLNVVIYTDSPEASAAPELNVQIDGGRPKRALGVLVPNLTQAERLVALPASEREPAIPIGDGHARWYPHSVFVKLGQDLAPGVHQIRIAPVERRPMWARFFVYEDVAQEAPARVWNRMGWDEEDAP